MAKLRLRGLQGSLAVAILALMLVAEGRAAAQAVTADVSAQDGRRLAGETLETQARFQLVWGDRAAVEWVLEHNAALASKPRGTTTPVATTPRASGTLTVVAGQGPPLDSEHADRLEATSTPLTLRGEIATLPDGSFVVIGRAGGLGLGSPRGDGVLRVDPAGTIHTLVGPAPGRGDGGPAIDAILTPSALAYDSGGGLIVADATNGIRTIDPNGTIRSLVPAAPSGQCAARHSRGLCNASDVAVSSDGTLYVADPAANAVYRMGADGRFEVFAGGPEPSTRPSGATVEQGRSASQTAVGAGLQGPVRLAVGPDGSVFIGEAGRVSRVSPDGLLQVVAGTGERPALDSTDAEGDGGRALDARVGRVAGLAVAPDGSLYIVDETLRRLRRITPDGLIREVALQGTTSPNLLRTIASGPDGSLYAVYPSSIDRIAPDGSVAEVATRSQVGPLDSPAYRNDNQGTAFLSSVAVAPDGTLFAADIGRGRIQRIRPDGTADHIAGSSAPLQPGAPALNRRPSQLSHLVATSDGTIYFAADGRSWKLAGDGALSEFAGPAVFPLGAGPDGSLHYIAQNGGGGLRRQSAGGITTTLLPGFATVWAPVDGAPSLGALGMVSVAASGTIYAADIVGKRVWRVRPDGTATVIYSGNVDSIALGPRERLFVSLTGFSQAGGWSRVDVIPADGAVARFAGTGVPGDGGDTGPATNALLAHPAGLAPAPDGGLFIVDRANNRVRHVTADGTIRTVAGVDYGGVDGEPALNAHLRSPRGLASPTDGSLLVADAANYRVRRIAIDGSVTTVAGSGFGELFGAQPERESARTAAVSPNDVALAQDGSVYAAGGKSALSGATLVYHIVGTDVERETAPIDSVGVTVDSSGELIVVGSNVAERRSRDGVWSVIAGQAAAGYNGDDQPAVNAQLSNPMAVAVAPGGSVYIADFGNNRVRRITPDGTIHTVAGNGEQGFSGDGGPATQAQLDGPAGLAVAADGTLFIADSRNERVRRVARDGTIDTVAGTGLVGDGPANATATQVDLNTPTGLALGPDGSLSIADTGNGRIRRLWGATSP